MHYTRWKRHGDPTQVRVKTQRPATNGYMVISATGHPLAMSNGDVYLHRKVLYDAIGSGAHSCYYCETPLEWNSDLHVDHKNEDKSDNGLDNLVPCCASCNSSKNFHNRVMTDDQILQIRDRLDNGYRGIGLILAQEFGIDPSTVSRIKLNKSYRVAL